MGFPELIASNRIKRNWKTTTTTATNPRNLNSREKNRFSDQIEKAYIKKSLQKLALENPENARLICDYISNHQINYEENPGQISKRK
jgi:hypothetical protein